MRAPWRVVTPSQAESLREIAARHPTMAPRLAYLAAFLSAGPAGFLESADLERIVLIREEGAPLAIPVVVNDGRERRCYLLSPRVHYVDYMRVELAKMRDNAPARWMSRAVWALGRIGEPLGFNRCVSVNNWLFTTNPTASLEAEDVEGVIAVLARRHPREPLVFRSVDARPPEVRAAYERAGCRLVVNRPVFEWSPGAAPASSTRREIARDLHLLERLESVDRATDDMLRPGEEQRVAELYRRLYLEKHSGYNAHYSPAFFRALADTGLCRFLLFRRAGTILGFVTYFVEPTRIVGCLVGYDPTIDRRRFPLYRAGVAALLRLSRQQDRTLFLSTGAAEFKRNRGAQEWLEHEAVYDRHLPRHRRLPWWSFAELLDRTVGTLDTSQL